MSKSKSRTPANSNNATDSRGNAARDEKSTPHHSLRIGNDTTSQSSTPDGQKLDLNHFCQWPGVLKLLQLVVAALCMTFYSPPITWFTRSLHLGTIICFTVTTYYCLFYLFVLRRSLFSTWPWLKVETICTNLAAVSYLFLSLLQLIFTNKEEYIRALRYQNLYHNYVVAGAFGLVNSVLYAVGGLLLYKKSKRKRHSLACEPSVSAVSATDTGLTQFLAAADSAAINVWQSNQG